jgi:hypothetical protein
MEREPTSSASDTPEATSRKVMNATQASKQQQDRDAIKAWADGVRERADAGEPRNEEQARKDRAAGITPEMIETERQQQQKDDEPGLAHRDPWDEPGAVNRPEPEEPADIFEQHRRGKSHVLEAPKDVHWLDDGAIKDLGFVTAKMNVPQEVAQALIGNYVLASEKEREALRAGGGSYDVERTLSELRAEWGAELEPIHEKIVKFTTSNPALADYLDSTGLGSSPEVVRMLMGAATVGTTRAQARAFIDKVRSNPKHPYWQGQKLAVAQMRFAFMLAGEDA